MEDSYNPKDRVFSADAFKQFNQLNRNTNSRIPIFFCIDISASMGTKVGFFETRISLLSKVMRKLLENMKRHPILGERAVIGIVTYNKQAVVEQEGLDLSVVDISAATQFTISGQTVFSKGLRRTLQAIDQYREGVRCGDIDTFKPMMVFMTDGEPFNDDDDEIANIYNEIWRRVGNNDLYVFPVGIGRGANMSYVNALRPDNIGYQIINENDFEKVFSEIEKIVNGKSFDSVEEEVNFTEKASQKADTPDTGAASFIDIAEFERFAERLVDFH